MMREDARYQAADIAAYVISYSRGISNLRLQKILFFCQSEHIRRQGTPLFSDTIVAWQYGPVVKNVYYSYAHRGASNILKPMQIVIDARTLCGRPVKELDNETRELVQEMVEAWKDKSVWDLVNESHKLGGPWDRVYNRGGVEASGYGDEITVDIIAECIA